MELITAAEMRRIEREAIDSGAVSGLALMERAGAGVVDAALERWPTLADGSHRAQVWCGPGNNGGDGFVVARLLRQRGWDVRVVFRPEWAETLPPDAAHNHSAARALDIPVVPFDRAGGEADLSVDALFGAGLTRPLADDMPATMGGRSVAVDAPSGLCLDSGRIIGERAIGAQLTVTFHKPRPGHYIAEGPGLCGDLAVVDIGLGGAGAQRRWLADLPPASRGKSASSHKYTHGHTLVVSGPAGSTGAARLAARGALRAGAGLVTLASPPDAMAENAAQLTAIMLRRMEGTGGLRDILGDTRISAIVIGPALGIGASTREMIGAALSARRRTVLDADALTTFAEDPDALFGQLHRDCVLTPHMGEFARLFPDLSARLGQPAKRGPAFSKIDAVEEAARRAGCTIVLKGADSLVGRPGGVTTVVAAVYGRAAPWLATAGSGDVLAGMIAGDLQRDTADAAVHAVWLHQEAGRRLGPGMIAEDIPEALPAILRDLISAGPL